MVFRNGPQLPSIDYVLSSVAKTYNYNPPASTRTERAPALHEPLQNALSQWGNTLTAPRSLCISMSVPRNVQDPQPIEDPGNSLKIIADEKQTGVSQLPSTYRSLDVSSSTIAAFVSPPTVQREPLAEKQPQSTFPQSTQGPEHANNGHLDSDCNSKSLSTSLKDTTVDRIDSKKNSVGKKRKGSNTGRKQSGRTTDIVVVDQLATCRERLSKIDFQAIERSDGLVECSICHESYRTKTLVTRHAVSHLEDPKPFSCSNCKKRFSRCDTLHRHTKRKACKIEPRSAMVWEV